MRQYRKIGNSKNGNSVFFHQRHALSTSFDIFAVTYRVTIFFAKTGRHAIIFYGGYATMTMNGMFQLRQESQKFWIGHLHCHWTMDSHKRHLLPILQWDLENRNDESFRNCLENTKTGSVVKRKCSWLKPALWTFCAVCAMSHGNKSQN